VTPNNTFDRTAGSHSLAAAGQRARSAYSKPSGAIAVESGRGVRIETHYAKSGDVNIAYQDGPRDPVVVPG
jgi:hypothetical protein